MVEQFCNKHLEKIRNYINNVKKIIPIPTIPMIPLEQYTLNRSSLRRTDKSHYGILNF